MGDKKTSKTLVHTFANETYLPWTEMFLEAVRIQHGYDFDVWMDVYNVSEDKKRFLERIYPLTICDQGNGYAELAEQQGVSLETVYEWRDQVAGGITTETNFPFKLFMSVDKRYRNLYEVVRKARAQGYKYVIHSDIDIYIRRPLTDMLELMKEYDVGFYFRHHEEKHQRKTLGAFLVFHLTDGAEQYVKCWMDEIDAVSKKERWIGFGQSTQYFAYKKSSTTRFADFSKLDEAPRYSKSYNKDAHLWLNSNSVMPGRGDMGFGLAQQRSWDDLKDRLPRVPVKNSGGMWYGKMRVYIWKIKQLVLSRFGFAKK